MCKLFPGAYGITADSDWFVHGIDRVLLNALKIPKPTDENGHMYKLFMWKRERDLFTAHRGMNMTNWNDNDLVLAANLGGSDYLKFVNVALQHAVKFVNDVRALCADVVGGTESIPEWKAAIRATLLQRKWANEDNIDSQFARVWKAICAFRTQWVYAIDLVSTKLIDGQTAPDPFVWTRCEWEPENDLEASACGLHLHDLNPSLSEYDYAMGHLHPVSLERRVIRQLALVGTPEGYNRPWIYSNRRLLQELPWLDDDVCVHI